MPVHDPEARLPVDGRSAVCATLTPSTAPETARLLRSMGYRIHHAPEDGYVWEWRHPRHRQNNRWETGGAHTVTADEAWQDALGDAVQRTHPRHDDLMRTLTIEHERRALRQAMDHDAPASRPSASVGRSSRRL